MKFRKKPVVIDAWRVGELVHAAEHNWSQLPVEVQEAYEEGLIIFASDKILVHTLEGIMEASLASWLLRGVEGEFYPCRDDIFRATYEEV